MNQALITRFAQRVAADPDATAVVEGDRRITYGQLSDLSTNLAQRLIVAGAAPGDVIAVLCDRSIEWVVAVLAILRAGGAYLPLPPDLPRERRLLLLREGTVRHVLRHPAVEQDLGDAASFVDIQTLPGPPVELPLHVVPPPGQAADRACVLFTSGTTGTPKGVVVRQSSLVRLVVDTNYITFRPTDVVAFASNTAFDAVSFEVWGALLNGSRLVVIPTATLLSPSAFETAIQAHGISVLFLTTELFNRVARARPTAFRSLTWLLFGGEKANAECVRAILGGGGSPGNLLHVYGPTECTTFTTCHRVTAVPAGASTIPIGRAIAGWQIHLFDDRLRPVPDGEEGELCVSGDGLAEGYLHNPEETAAVFTTIPDDEGEIRIYRTGDVARRQSGGPIEYIGRRDGQIKLRGVRIEPGEVEAALAYHPLVRDAVVLAYHGPGGAPRLGGCLQMHGTTSGRDIAGIRAFVARRLPAPMVPTRLLGYEAFPLTASKKVDRQRLVADLQQADRDGPTEHAGGPFVPADAVEERLAAIWRETLGRSPHSADENFFEAGGDSLQAVDVQLRIENAWSIALSPSMLIEWPTFRDLAEHLRRRDAPDVRPVVWLTRGPRRPAMACVPGVLGHVFFFRSLAPLWPTDRGLCALPSRHLAPHCDRRLLTVEEIAEENLARLEEAGLAPVEALAGYSFGGLVAYEMARRMAMRGQPPALILYDTAAAHECLRASFAQRLRFFLPALVHRPCLRYGRVVPAALFSPGAANLVAAERYRPQPHPGGMLLVRSTIAGVSRGVHPETMGWEGLVQGPLTIRSVAAPHDDFFRQPHVAEVAAITNEYLRQQHVTWRRAE